MWSTSGVMPWREDKHPRRFGWLCVRRCAWFAEVDGGSGSRQPCCMGSKPRSIETSLLRGSACKAGGPGESRSGEGSTYGTVTRKGEGRSGTLDGYYWVREVQSGPPLGPSRSKGSEAGRRLSSDSSRGSKCPPPRFLRRGRAAGRRRSVLNGDSRRIGVAESSRSRRARWGSMDVSVGMFGKPSR